VPKLTLEADTVPDFLELLARLFPSGQDPNELKELIIMAKQETLADLQFIKSAIGKIGGETGALLDKVKTLEDKIAAAGDSVPADVAALAAEIRGDVQRIDDMVPDAPAGGDTSNPGEPTQPTVPGPNGEGPGDGTSGDVTDRPVPSVGQGPDSAVV